MSTPILNDIDLIDPSVPLPRSVKWSATVKIKILAYFAVCFILLTVVPNQIYSAENNEIIYVVGIAMFSGVAASGAGPSDVTRVVGPNACAECHKQEAEAWKATHHFKTFRDMPRNEEAKRIADRMGVKRIKSESLCLNCHFTLQVKEDVDVFRYRG